MFYAVILYCSVIEQLGGKQLVMQLLAHEDPNVRYEALLAVQKLMVHNWEYLGRQLEKEQTGDGKAGTAALQAKSWRMLQVKSSYIDFHLIVHIPSWWWEIVVTFLVLYIY